MLKENCPSKKSIQLNDEWENRHFQTDKVWVVFFFLPLVNPNEKPAKNCFSELKLKNLLKAVFENQTHRKECDTKTKSRQEICVWINQPSIDGNKIVMTTWCTV